MTVLASGQFLHKVRRRSLQNNFAGRQDRHSRTEIRDVIDNMCGEYDDFVFADIG